MLISRFNQILSSPMNVPVCLIDVCFSLVQHLPLLQYQGFQLFLHLQSIMHPILYGQDLFLLDFNHALVVHSLLVDLHHFDSDTSLALAHRF